jgi:ribosome-binding protein aMBF1 (putative translation factor)
MITGAQIRAARAALGWSIAELAAKSGVGVRTIKRFEAVDGIPASRTSTLIDLKGVLESAGIEFTGTETERPGVTFLLGLAARKQESRS